MAIQFRRITNPGSFDSELSRPDNDNACTLTLHLNIHLRCVNPPGNHDQGTFADGDGVRRPIRRWPPGEWTMYGPTFARTAEEVWNNRLTLHVPDPAGPHRLPPADWQALNHTNPQVRRYTPFVRCALQVHLVDPAHSHAVIRVVYFTGSRPYRSFITARPGRDTGALSSQDTDPTTAWRRQPA